MRSSLIIPKREILFSPMLSTFGGGSARGFNPGGGGGPAVGEYLFETTGTHSFVVPQGVLTACFLIIGGGGTGGYNTGYGGGNGGDLFYINDVEMNSGETWTIKVASGNPSQFNTQATGSPSEAYIGAFQIGASSGISFGNNPSGFTQNGTYNRNTSGRANGSLAYNSGGRSGPTSGGGSISAGGAGAAGYSSNGGDGGSNGGSWLNPTDGSGGGGAGGGGSNQGTINGAGGGGVGVYGEGSSGTAGSNGVGAGSPTGGGGGSNGGNGGNGASNSTGIGGEYGGGGGSPRNETSSSSYGQSGAVRILWGEGRAFPSTNVDLASSDGNQTIV